MGKPTRVKKLRRFIVVYEDVWHNKEVYFTKLGKIGNTLEEICHLQGVKIEFDKKKLNSYDPYDQGTFGEGFYDIWGEEEDGESFRIMIFPTEE